MRLSVVLFGLGLTLGLAGSSSAIDTLRISDKDIADVLPGGYIVELDNDQAVTRLKKSAGQTRNIVPGTHEHFFTSLSKRKVSYTTRQHYNDSRLFVGASFLLHSADDVKELLSIDGVKGITPIRIYPRPQPAPGTKAITIDVSAGLSKTFKDSFSTHAMTGVDKLHAEGYAGEGTLIGILDSGIGVHSALGGDCWGQKGCKIHGGYDLVGDDYDGDNTPHPDPDPVVKTCSGASHGTHVSGIIAAEDNALGFNGVVPKAKINMYRIFGCSGSAANDIVIKAMERAFHDGVDVISMSLGGPSGWAESPDSAVASRIAHLGTPVVTAAGNDGAMGMFYSSSPATAYHVVSVGSVDNSIFPGYNTSLSDGHAEITYLSALPFDIGRPMPIYFTSTNTSNPADACEPLPDSTPDLSGYIVIIQRGTCLFTTKYTHAKAKKAKFVLIYNNAGAGITYLEDHYKGLRTAFLQREDGVYLAKQYAAGKNVTLDFSSKQLVGIANTKTGGYVSDYSTFGPTTELAQKPTILAPGGNILSTLPNNTYGMMSGTSMATPFLSGCLALYMSAKGDRRLADVPALRALFASTANPVAVNVSSPGIVHTTAQQGSGLVNLYDAVQATTLVTPSHLALNDTKHFVRAHTLRLHNLDTRTQVFALQHEPAGTALTYDARAPTEPIPYPVPLIRPHANVTFASSTVTVEPGQTAEVSAFFEPPVAGLKARQFPVYSGFIKLVPLEGTQSVYRVPYMGVAASMEDCPVLDYGIPPKLGVQMPALVSPSGNVITKQHVYSLTDNSSQPALVWKFSQGTKFYQTDLVKADIDFSPTISNAEGKSGAGKIVSGKRRLGNEGRRSAQSQQQSASPSSKDDLTFDQVPTLGQMDAGAYESRSSNTGNQTDNGYNGKAVTGTFLNGTLVPDGVYRVLIRAQRPFTDGTLQRDYDSYLSPSFTVRRQP